MIGVETPQGKRALAESLGVHDPEFLEDLKMIAARLGPFAAVHYASTRPDVHEKIEADVARAKSEYVAEMRGKAKGEIEKMKQILGATSKPVEGKK